ncbi:hypothetical protein Tcan_11764 [Toxocara canis]|uniref:Uncharacterized protein n=1 Tax=Toxocara canis TaxID=6265 RepID=A0A0B2UT40_TOXCA|nr:hypothetical protein Tcan_11764 [Toxocara canis]
MVIGVIDQKLSRPAMSLRPTNSYPIDQKAKVCDKRDSIRTKFRPSDAPKDWCRLCTRVVYLPAEGMPTGSRDKTWCLPCDCSQPVHHGCIVANIRKQSRCKKCGYKYKYFRDRLQQLRLGALLLNRTLSGVSSVYQQRIDQASIAGMTAFDHDHWLASSTPLLDCTKQQFEFAMQEKPKETDTNQNMCAVHQPARISSTLIVHEYSDDPSLRGESASPQWSKSTTVTDALNVDVTEP